MINEDESREFYFNSENPVYCRLFPDSWNPAFSDKNQSKRETVTPPPRNQPKSGLRISGTVHFSVPLVHTATVWFASCTETPPFARLTIDAFTVPSAVPAATTVRFTVPSARFTVPSAVPAATTLLLRDSTSSSRRLPRLKDGQRRRGWLAT